jgi:hypothetical protein
MELAPISAVTGLGEVLRFRFASMLASIMCGAFARERAIKARRAEMQRLEVDRNEANSRVQEITRLLEAVDDISALAYADSLAELLALHRDLRRIEMLLAQLDTSGSCPYRMCLCGFGVASCHPQTRPQGSGIAAAESINGFHSSCIAQTITLPLH